ncbi:MAG TPA: ligase-associated DNA damage response DEXH box helicase [Alphaproteobacteria bacterium]|nr:ligase-associated DNA damage response DEXH box helicase [Alphaproteobacteria bacterium]
MSASAPAIVDLSQPFSGWFSRRGWRPHAHQLEMLAAAARGESALLIAPTGGGKTLAGFLPTLVELTRQPKEGLHSLYISPLKALAVDIHRNLEQPIAEMGLAIRAETRTGDTPQAKRERQRRVPPQLLLTTPESLALLLSYEDSARLFAGLRSVIVDELHALADNKRGDLLALGLARLAALAPRLRRIGLSATIAEPGLLQDWLSPEGDAAKAPVRLIRGGEGPQAEISILMPRERMPWSGHMALHAMPEVMRAIRAAGCTIVFVNTRAQAELVFQALWRLNDDNLPIALHHGSLAAEQRRKVEAAMARGALKAVVATSSLDLGIDWGAVDLVIQVGAPKGASRLVQRIGRSNHRLDRPSKALLVPGNRFELLECRAAIEAVAAAELDRERRREGALDVLAQHITGIAAADGFQADALFAEVRRAGPYRHLARREFDDTLAFVATGGYALGGYERFRRLVRDGGGSYRVASPDIVRRYRMNVGTIVEQPMLQVRLGGRRLLGEVEEYFIQGLVPGDTFVFSGELLRFEGVRETAAIVTRTTGEAPRIPAYAGGRLPLTTNLAARVRAILASPPLWRRLPPEVGEWLEMQERRSVLPMPEGLLVELFPRGGKEYLVAYCFEGRNAHQTLGMLLTRRMERMGAHPLGFVASDYCLAVWSLAPPRDVPALFDRDMLGDDLEAWMAESTMLKRTFRNVAVIAGLIERRHPGWEKTARQVTFNSDLIYDVLRRHEPNHVLLRATRADAATGLTDVRRLAEMLERVAGSITVKRLPRVSPLAVPVLLDIGRESVYGAAIDTLLDEAAAELVAEAYELPDPQGVLL